jgi:2-polyprenyl-3-methyl-5-hydroxy-6-metoxy-1,4-benzoquinol methylase
MIKKYSEDVKICLDIGCGRGVYTNLFASCNVLTIGIDISKDELAATKNWAISEGNSEQVQLINASAELLPFKEQSFGMVICSEVIEHLQSPQKGVAEISRVVSENGNVIITAPNALSYFWLEFKVGYEILRLVRLRTKSLETERHTSFPYTRTLGLLKESDLTAHCITSTNIFPLPFLLMSKIVLHPRLMDIVESLDNRLRQSRFKIFGSSIIVFASKRTLKRDRDR